MQKGIINGHPDSNPGHQIGKRTRYQLGQTAPPPYHRNFSRVDIECNPGLAALGFHSISSLDFCTSKCMNLFQK